MESHYLKHIAVSKLWGYRNFEIDFHRDVNVIIGPNASGKTTLINILYDTFTGNIFKLCRLQYQKIEIELCNFESNKSYHVRLTQSEDVLSLQLDKTVLKLPIPPILQYADDPRLSDMPMDSLARRFKQDINFHELVHKLRNLVPAVWLPVSRRLPIADEEESSRRRLHRKPLESVDECLAGLIESLQQYRLSLNTDLSELRKIFQRHALENILYDKKHDRAPKNPGLFMPPSEQDKEALLKAFRDVGLVDRSMESRINEHFDAAKEAVARLKKKPDGLDFNMLFIIPLINRTRSIVEFAQELEADREKLFSPLYAYKKIVNSFLINKNIDVSSKGELVILSNKDDAKPIDWRHLSSGEKQILILLTQALLSGKASAVYVADEPELSLHVMWQEKLLGALTKLASKCQFIVATHSPDIASGFGSKIIDLGRF